MSEAISQYIDADNESLHKWQLDMREELENFKLQLQGYEINPDYSGPGDKAYIKTSTRPFTNELGAIQIKNRLMGVVNKAASDTNLTQEKINKEMKEFDVDVSTWLATSHKEFEIRPKDYNSVCEMMIEFAINIWHRSIKGWKGGLINAPGNVKEIYYPNSVQQSGGGIGKKTMGFFGR